jgi:HAD superfamily phosphatase (TIGR01668 family)
LKNENCKLQNANFGEDAVRRAATRHLPSIFNFQFSIFILQSPSVISLLTPHHRIASVLELTPERLRSLGLKSLLLDADCTLKRYRGEDCAPGVAEWLETLRQAGFGLCLVSNGLGERIGQFAETVGLPYVAKAMKPLPQGCLRAVRKMGFQRETTAMVGDQVFADILAGRLAGLTTFLVEPIHPEEEPWFTRLKRPLERWLR